MKIIFKRIILSVCLLLFILCVGVIYFYAQALSTMNGDSIITARTWIDSNGNGAIDASEPPLQKVCVWASKDSSDYNADQTENICAQDYQYTDIQGEWSKFSGGRYCDGWYFFVKPPTGYEPTTALGAKGCTAQFGFIPEDSGKSFDVLTAAEFAKKASAVSTLEIIQPYGILAMILLGVILIPILVIRPPKKQE